MGSAAPSHVDISDLSILFLTTTEYSTAPTLSNPHSTPADIATLPLQNAPLALALQSLGANVRFSSWRHPHAASTRATLCRFDAVLFACCDGYATHYQEFMRWLAGTLGELAEVMGRRMRVCNGVRVVRWNAEKGYLRELEGVAREKGEEDGWKVVETETLDLDAEAGARIGECGRWEERLREIAERRRWERQVVLKPRVGASGQGVHLIQDVEKVTANDRDAMNRLLEHGNGVLVQQFIPTVRTHGEYSLIFLGGSFSHAEHKRPRAGEFRVNDAYGGGSEEVNEEDLPRGARETGERVWRWLEERFGRGEIVYMRVDGFVSGGGGSAEDEGGGFVIGEVELIEPEMWLMRKDGQERVERFVRALLSRRGDKGEEKCS